MTLSRCTIILTIKLNWRTILKKTSSKIIFNNLNVDIVQKFLITFLNPFISYFKFKTLVFK